MHSQSSVRCPALCALVTMFASTPLVAQLVDDARIGASLRVTMFATGPTQQLRGTLVAQDSAALVLSVREDDMSNFRVLAADIRRVEWLYARRPFWRSVGRGAAWGALTGVVASIGLFTWAAIDDERNPCTDCWLNNKAGAAILAVPLTLGTTMIGAAVGPAFRDRWREEPLRRRR